MFKDNNKLKCDMHDNKSTKHAAFHGYIPSFYNHSIIKITFHLNMCNG